MENQSTTPSTQFLLLEQVQFLKVKDDSLLQWELVNVFDTEEQGDDDGGSNSIVDGFGSWDSSNSWSVSSPNDAPIEGIRHCLLHPDADVEGHHDDVDDHHLVDGDADGYGKGQVDDEDYGDGDDDDDDDDGCDLDDELVPWNVNNKLGRQRMRKLGKRAFSKMHSSKRSPYLFVSPGCVRGKHGLGLKHLAR